MKLEQNSVRAFPKGWLFLFSGFLLFLTALVHGTGFSAGGSNVQYLPVVQRPFGEYWSYRYEVEGAYYRPSSPATG